MTVFNDTADLPAAMQTTYGKAFFAKRTLIRLKVGVGCSDAKTTACKSFGWPSYAARCKQAKGVEHPVIELKKLADVSVWPDGYKPKEGELAAFSWHISYKDFFDIPPHFCKPVVTDTYWFSVPKTSEELEARSTSYGSDLCMCMD